MKSRLRRLGLNFRRYTISTLKYLVSTKEYKKYKSDLRAILPKRKIERQWWDIRAKFGYQISKKEFTDYYALVRKANRKLNRIKGDKDLLARVKLPLGVGWIQRPKQLRLQLGRIKRILSRDYKRELSNELRERLYGNIIACFGYNEEANQLINEFKAMTDMELLKFFKLNPVLNRMMYDSDQSALLEYLNRAGIGGELVQSAIEDFAKREGLENIIISKIE